MKFHSFSTLNCILVMIVTQSIPLYSNSKSFINALDKADALILSDSTVIEVNKDGTYTATYQKRIKILSLTGIEKFGEKIFPFSASFGTISVVYARVYKPNGDKIDVSSENIEIYREYAWEGAKFFIPNIYYLKITFPQLEIGSEIEYKVRDIFRGTAIENHFQRYIIFEDEEPIRQKVLRVDAPKEMDLKWVVIRNKAALEDTGILFDKEINDKRVIHTWFKEDICPIEKEPSIPYIGNIATKLLISTLPSWEFLSKWYYEISLPTFKSDLDIRLLVSDLIEEDMSREEKIRACFNWVVENIRYVETELTGPKAGLRPAPASKTLKREYGVCRDMAAFLICLLGEAGVESRIALINPLVKIEDTLPVDQFNHTIVAVKSDTGYFYIDPTPDNSKEYLPAYEYNAKAVLICTQEGEKLRYTPQEEPEKNTLRVIERAKLDSENRLTGIFTLETTGYMDYRYRNLFKRISPDKVKEIATNFITKNNPSAVIDTFYIKGLESLEEELSINAEYHIDDYGNMMGDIISIHSPISESWKIDILFRGENPFALRERKYPVDLEITSNISYHGEISIPDLYRIEGLPERYEFSNEYLCAKKFCEFKNDKIITDSEFIISKSEIPVEQYNAIKKLHENLDKYSRQKIILKRRL
jgi:transglutaminase-like putative cysteine protease